ncbi:MAG: lactate utilization protein [Planctomycetaceae bacterium]|jgi:L-lactate dehydrogenase complex protein LldF|nr:lactate utilization protein [Planctomycetaceae bacterium]
MSGAEFLVNETHGLYEPHGLKVLSDTSERVAQTNLEMCWAIDDWSKWRQAAHDIKAYTVAHLDQLLDQFARNLEQKGVTVLWAEDAAEANRLVLEIAKKNQVKTVVKAKSMLSEEIELNHTLSEHGITALETDLGEYIIQLAHQRPTHIVMPALHLKAAEIGQLFTDKLGEPFTAEHRELTMIARKRLRKEFLTADMGISGINFGVAETGSFCLIENEGNIGLSTTVPKVHVALMGIEKILPKLEHLPLFLNILPRMGTGQKLTSYTHVFNGPTQGREMYVILVDNGRTRMIEEPEFRTMLYCLRCGLCLNNCPVYRHVGAWAYGWVYPGPMGTVLTSNLVGLEKASSLPFASSLCGACSEICPAKIDLAHMIIRLRRKAIEQKTKARNLLDVFIWKGYAWAMRGKFRYKLLMTGMKIGMRFVPFLPWHPNKLGQWTRGRALPEIPKESSFRDWWKKREKK